MHAMRTSVVLSLSKIEMNIEKISNGRNKFLLNKFLTIYKIFITCIEYQLSIATHAFSLYVKYIHQVEIV